MNERTYSGSPQNLQSDDRARFLQADHVVSLCTGALSTGNVLDIGCGGGLFSRLFCELGFSVTGVDVRQEMVDAAAVAVPSGRFEKAAAESLPYPNDLFDIVLMACLLHETDSPQRTLAESYRVCKNLTAVLEWRYKNEPFGPPIGHRLKETDIYHWGIKAGFSVDMPVQLDHVQLFIMHKPA